MEYNGGSVIAMRGKNCVAIATDMRLGNQALLVSTNFDKVFKVTDRTYVGLPGLATDLITLREKFRYRLNMYRMKEDRDIEPETFAHLMSSTLYERRYVFTLTQIWALLCRAGRCRAQLQGRAVHCGVRSDRMPQLCQGLCRERHGKRPLVWYGRGALGARSGARGPL